MKLTHRQPDRQPRPRGHRAAEVLSAETPPEEVVFDPQEFWKSPTMLELKSWIKEQEVGADLLTPTRPETLTSSFWLARLDPEFQSILQKHLPTLKKEVEETFVERKAFIRETKNPWEIKILTQQQHQRLIVAIQGLYRPGEVKDLIQRMDINFNTLIKLVRDQPFVTRLDYARFLVFEFPAQREKILSALFESQERDPEKLLDGAKTMRSGNLFELLLVFPEIRERLAPVLAPVIEELRADYLRGLKTQFGWMGDGVTFIQKATDLAILSADRTWIDQDGLLQFEFKQPRVGVPTKPLPDRPAI